MVEKCVVYTKDKKVIVNFKHAGCIGPLRSISDHLGKPHSIVFTGGNALKWRENKLWLKHIASLFKDKRIHRLVKGGIAFRCNLPSDVLATYISLVRVPGRFAKDEESLLKLIGIIESLFQQDIGKGTPFPTMLALMPHGARNLGRDGVVDLFDVNNEHHPVTPRLYNRNMLNQVWYHYKSIWNYPGAYCYKYLENGRYGDRYLPKNVLIEGSQEPFDEQYGYKRGYSSVWFPKEKFERLIDQNANYLMHPGYLGSLNGSFLNLQHALEVCKYLSDDKYMTFEQYAKFIHKLTFF